MKKYSILLYYCYTPIEDVELFRGEHHLLCLDLNLLGRVIIAPEGINGTVSGLEKDCEEYMQTIKLDSRFADIDFKVETSSSHVFAKLHVRAKPEIVHADLPQINPREKTGIYLSPTDFKHLKDSPDVVLLDVRSNYEHKIGKFKNAVTLDIENFREFPEKSVELEKYRGKKIVTYCTGGIKCEKASAFLLEKGFENVYQLHGGIIKYGIEEGGEGFEGKCYVFDNRVAAEVNKVNPSVFSVCHICATPCDRMVNCANAECNDHVAICEKCGWTLEGTCSTECLTNPAKRQYDGTGVYPKKTINYDPRKGLQRVKQDNP